MEQEHMAVSQTCLPDILHLVHQHDLPDSHLMQAANRDIGATSSTADLPRFVHS